ncbi:efflux RND transporter periplasmic adaptor subunit [Aromatoleum toluclasticum]|uniref:efflux RND transporter periplasmic adaptor subunit n=1 Tax=Aromatoleum toluclasticum TaxID=92003 RepID=UPI001D185F57|nr:efflux RND transporter periplasmic adaptor subunit [Aromatoleum toluclasticum]MCC4118163.1 efflux RND transporter periplasmic adaptor subunit [Aromatoleum toluclasticum]
MKLKNILIGLAAAGVLGTAGFGLYRLGMARGMGMSAIAPAAAVSPDKTPAAAPVDPSTWGVPEGEAAARRHIADGLRAGRVDPLTGRKILYYHDPMVPGKKFEAPGKSPFMDMMLVPAYAGAQGADAGTVTISSRIQQNLGLRTAPAAEGALSPAVSAVGAIAWNERDQAVVQARAMGYVEKLHVRATLDRVAKGQPLAELYVPDWVAAQEDFLSVRRMRGTDLEPLADAARARMRQAGMDEAQIRLVESSGRVQARLAIRAPIDGVVTELTAREGMTVMPGMPLARINGLSTVWADAEVPESQAALLRPDVAVVARTPALPGASFEGRVQALLPEVNPETRTLKARMELANPQGQLVPGMFVRMRFSGEGGRKTLQIPTEAIIHTGRRTLVMVAEENGAFRPAEVVTGIEAGGQTEIRQGLRAGERVVLSGQFLIDSEASLAGIEARLGDGARAVADTHRTAAVIEAINGDVLTLSHPAIASLGWPAMTMDFKLSPGLDPAGLTVGREVDVEFRMQEGAAPQIVSVRPAVPGEAAHNAPGVAERGAQ